MPDNRFLLSMECSKCSASIDLDLDNLIAFCPYCGNKLMIDPVDLKEVLVEKEKTKRVEMRYSHEEKKFEKKEARRRTLRKAIPFTVAFTVVFLLLGTLGEGIFGDSACIGMTILGLLGVPATIFCAFFGFFGND